MALVRKHFGISKVSGINGGKRQQYASKKQAIKSSSILTK